MIRKLLFFLLIFFFNALSATAQNDLCRLRISLLTCGAGEELYSTFGHSALRVTDSISGSDVVYNYGTFNFDEPDFYTKFIRGKLLYYLSTEDFLPFVQSYQQEKRTVTEQLLNLTCGEKEKMLQLLQQNLQAENRYYKYDFLFDNCTTRLRDLLEKSSDSIVQYKKIVEPKTTFRDLLYVSLNYYDKQWSKLGIDLLLGANTDDVMKTKEVMYLPAYLMYSFDSSSLGSKPVVAVKQDVFELSQSTEKEIFIKQPLFFFSMLLVIIVCFTFSKNKALQKFVHSFDGFLFFLCGLAGLVFIFMWFGTDHQMYSYNYNLLWALPTHAVAAFFVHSKKTWVKKYFLVTTIINVLLLIGWFFLPQHLNISLLPFVLLLSFRSAALYGK